MAVKIINDHFDKNLFNNKAFHPLQSWSWGEARKQMGIEVLRIGEFSTVGTIHELSLQNVYQLTFHKLPLTSYKIGYLPRSVLPSEEVLEFIYDYGEVNKIIFVKIEPYEEISNIKYQISQLHPRASMGEAKIQIKNQKLIKSKHPLFPEWTQILDLRQSDGELLKNMHHKTRYNIKLAEKKGVIVKETSDGKGFKIFSQLYFETCNRQKYFGHTPRYHQIIWNNLKNNISHILIAFYKDIPLAAYELFFYKDTLYYVYGGTSEQYRNLMASNLLMWEAIKLGKKMGAKKLDMWGSLPPNYSQNHSWAGFTRFKKGFGGKFTQFIGSYDLIVSPIQYQIYNIFYLGRQIYLRLKKEL
ncbi:hypothetical protein COS31_00570 [Candidatus Roizmanbacteria bacterium CG02_land_8_20_14_3_00_36_15]|uniref:Peptidoglycan bridge formation protein FemAB n=2 Tax=Candidatus Roizmaniibacteriota TaxID=1752723 RepID=A0A2M8KJR8_9BACT|nr:MAG: hypothetical protein COS51_00990 [Candidatus Roizmanbacteria bacterium CG03_land_8_20_14_0_80_36_21]PIV38239.1 MAG: hypothetical protein COS31_00570 [Candidatus Roizmanbacteria bacterium CG02_land_8_20_14_3_00_36_15]PIY70466.1 MAG: hypothetical protein COY89_01075 [Candidatus Roizmanbacteria bacterium CG_4_10_14_0_8_um_filter_36_36]PJA53693.1 MAG: hypothetical protein CO166_00925 [Candidatus Roizmanbacteria bacterium CG_4_9_14_3_um_filter_36_11]PJC81986.1 MAG: hypothetical protein CO007